MYSQAQALGEYGIEGLGLPFLETSIISTISYNVLWYVCYVMIMWLPGDVNSLGQLYISLFTDKELFFQLFGENSFEFAHKIVDFTNEENRPSKCEHILLYLFNRVYTLSLYIYLTWWLAFNSLSNACITFLTLNVDKRPLSQTMIMTKAGYKKKRNEQWPLWELPTYLTWGDN